VTINSAPKEDARSSNSTSVSIGQIYKKSGTHFSRELVVCEVHINSRHPYVVAYDRRRQYVVKVRMEKLNDKWALNKEFQRTK